MKNPRVAARAGALLAVLLAQLAGCGASEHGAAPVQEDGSGAGGENLTSGDAGGAGDSPVAAEAGGASGGDAGGGSAGAGGAMPSEAPYASRVESFTSGDGAGFNQDKLPDIVLGPPQGRGTGQGSLDVVSLGAGGEIVLGFGERSIVDGPGADLIVFENAFWPGGDPTQVFAELGEVSVSEDGETWHSFSCDTVGDGEGHYPGCAGVTPTLVFDADTLRPLDPEKTGGDAFDLADLGLARARFVKIRDLGTLEPAGMTGGFDLDAVGAVYLDP